MKLDIQLLTIFVTIFQTRSVSLAAQKLKLSQPGISSALKRLRTTLNDQLFIKSSNGMEPTHRAHELIGPVSEILKAIDKNFNSEAFFNPQTSKREFVIALSDIGEGIYLPLFLRKIQEINSSITLRSISLTPKLLEEAMVAGEVDLAAGFFPDIKSTQFLHRRVGLHSFACIMRKGHPLSKQKITIDRFLEQQHISIEAPGRSQEVFEKFLIEKKLVRKVILRTPHFMSVPFIVSETDAIATVPQALADFITTGNRLIQTRLPFTPPTFQVNIHWHKSVDKEPGNQWLRNIIFDNLERIKEKSYSRNGVI